MSTLPLRYQPLGTSAMGGFGEVHFCTDKHLDRKVAVKFITDPNQIKRSYDELRALLQLRSKHIVQVYDIVKCDDNSIGIVEEFIDGDDLWTSDYPKQTDEHFLKVLWQIASGISDIHRAKIIHRDIKPNNMKLDSEGVVKIYDFGLARDEGEDAKTKGFKGTLGFAAPEILSDDTVSFTSAIDTYAFGVSIFILSGDPIPKSLRDIPPKPPAPGVFSTKLSRNIPVDLASLLETCLSTDPVKRPKMTAVRDELARYLLKDKHQAIAVIGGVPSYLNAKTRKVSLSLPKIGSIEITYDGLHFAVTKVSGETYINNSEVLVGDLIPSSCVVTFGNADRKKSERAFVTFDVSNPEVVL